jgi:hypothetical protein
MMIVRHSPGARRITLGADKGYDYGTVGGARRAFEPVTTEDWWLAESSR